MLMSESTQMSMIQLCLKLLPDSMLQSDELCDLLEDFASLLRLDVRQPLERLFNMPPAVVDAVEIVLLASAKGGLLPAMAVADSKYSKAEGEKTSLLSYLVAVKALCESPRVRDLIFGPFAVTVRDVRYTLLCRKFGYNMHFVPLSFRAGIPKICEGVQQECASDCPIC